MAILFETTLVFALPEELGIFDNVYVHVQLENGQNISIPATHEFRYHSDNGIEWPMIFNDETKKPVAILNESKDCLTEPNSSFFGIIYTGFDRSYAKGSFCITFTGWKDEKLTRYYIEQKPFSLEIDEEDFEELYP